MPQTAQTPPNTASSTPLITSKRDTENTNAASLSAGPSSSSKHLQRVICVEDNAAIRSMISLALGDIGQLDVQTLACCDEAIQIVSDQGTDLILLDWDLPGRSATDTLTAIRDAACGRPLPVVVMAVRCTREMQQQAQLAGAISVLKKPLDPMRLASRLRQLYSKASSRRPN